MQHPALVDIGINLAHDSYDADRGEVLARARKAGIAGMVITGSSLESSRRAIELAGQWPGRMRATAGIHPHHATELQVAQRAELEELLSRPQVAAAGECGLDYYRNFSPPAEQRRAFALQLELAAGRGLPVFLHQRDAHGDFMAILREHLPSLAGGVLHCFTGNRAELEDCLAAGLSIGITGWICDERRGQPLCEAAAAIPDERLMLETDGPYLLPRNMRPKPSHRRNEPAYLPWVLARAAECRRQDPGELATATTRNACAFFGIRLGEESGSQAVT